MQENQQPSRVALGNWRTKSIATTITITSNTSQYDEAFRIHIYGTAIAAFSFLFQSDHIKPTPQQHQYLRRKTNKLYNNKKATFHSHAVRTTKTPSYFLLRNHDYVCVLCALFVLTQYVVLFNNITNIDIKIGTQTFIWNG